VVNHLFKDSESTWEEAMSCAQKLSRSSTEVLIATKHLMKAEYIPDVIGLIEKEALVFADRLKSDEAQSAFDAFLNR